MLCTPPAFILSQDQTLELFVLYRSFRSVIIIRAFFSSFFYFCLSSILFQNFSRFLSHYTSFRFVLISSLVVQFSMTDSRCPSKVTASLLYHIPPLIVKYFFQTFLNFFRLRVLAFRDLVILPHLFPFVKYFFYFFEKIIKFLQNIVNKLQIHRQNRLFALL